MAEWTQTIPCITRFHAPHDRVRYTSSYTTQSQSPANARTADCECVASVPNRTERLHFPEVVFDVDWDCEGEDEGAVATSAFFLAAAFSAANF